MKCVDRDRFEPYVVTILLNPKTGVISKLPADVKFIEFSFSSIFDFISLYKLCVYLRKEKIEAVITSLFDANLLARIAAIVARVPVILSSELNISDDKKRWQIIADNILARFTKKILVSSNEVLDFTSKQENIARDKFQLNFNGIPLKLGGIKQNRNQALHKFGLPEDQLYIVTAGSLTPQKGQTYLIDAVYELKQQGIRGFKVLIFGKGVLKDELTSKIEKLDLTQEIQFMGIAPIEEIMAISDIFTLPSLWEGLSIALLQAMDAGCPIVATKISGTNEALEDEVSALLVNPGESSELAATFKRILNDTGLRRQLANAAREQVKKFSIEENVKVIENLIWP
ncbi:MAG: glycosyltransferase family 4 protein [bacterium]|nr:glycosyltransferase family 4 protein [bacterium]